MKRYYSLNTYFQQQFRCRVHKISLDAGFSCPNRDGTISNKGCIYCNDKGSGTGLNAKGLSITTQLINGKKALTKRYKAKKFIGYFQSFSNTYAALDKLQSVYDEALSVDDIVGLSIGTRPDCVNQEILSLLETYAKKYHIWLEYGLQSIHNETLKFINRGHDFICFKKAIDATKKRGIKICVHVILGLPFESRKQMIETAKSLANLPIDGIKLHLLYVIKDTKLAEIYDQGKFNCLSQQEYVDIVCDFLEHTPNNIIMHRLTGDPHPEELISPLWSLKKTETLALINKTLETKKSWQGKSVDKIDLSHTTDLEIK